MMSRAADAGTCLRSRYCKPPARNKGSETLSKILSQFMDGRLICNYSFYFFTEYGP